MFWRRAVVVLRQTWWGSPYWQSGGAQERS